MMLAKNEIWTDIKNVYTEVSENKLGRKKGMKPKPYISEEVMNLAKEKSKARKDGRMEEYGQLKREVKCKIRRDRNDWLEKECNKIKVHNINRNPRELFIVFFYPQIQPRYYF